MRNSTRQQQEGSPSLVAKIITTGLLIWFGIQTSPYLGHSQYGWIPIVIDIFALVSCFGVLGHILLWFATRLDWASAQASTGTDGTSCWATFKDIKPELLRKKRGPFWGLMVGKKPKPLFIDFASNSMSVAPAGSGKGIYTVVPMGLSIHASKIFSDFKGELVCILKKPLEARGEIVRVLNPGNLWGEIIGKNDSYNPLDIIVDDLHRPDGLRDVPDDLREITAQILPEPAQGKSDDSFWREGSRRLIADVILLEAMIEEFEHFSQDQEK